MAVHQNYVNGAWTEAGEPTPNINPSNLSDVVGEYARANEIQVRAAIAAARAVSLQVLRRRGGAAGGRGAALGAPGNQGRDHARAGGRGRHHHALELPHRDSRLE